MRKKQEKRNKWEGEKRREKINLIFLMKCFSSLDVYLGHSLNLPSVVLTPFLPDGALYSLSWISAEKKWHPVTFHEFDLCRQPTCCRFSGAVPFFTAEFPHPRQTLINTLMYPLLWYSCLLSHGLAPCCNSFAPFNSSCSNASHCPHGFSGLCALNIQEYTGCLEWHNCCHVLQGWQWHSHLPVIHTDFLYECSEQF